MSEADPLGYYIQELVINYNVAALPNSSDVVHDTAP